MGGEAWKACGKEAFRAGGRHSEEQERQSAVSGRRWPLTSLTQR